MAKNHSKSLHAELQCAIAQVEKARQNLEALESVPDALESFVAFMTARGLERNPDYEKVYQKIASQHFEAQDGTVRYVSEFSGEWFFDPSMSPLAWRTKDGSEMAGVIRRK